MADWARAWSNMWNRPRKQAVDTQSTVREKQQRVNLTGQVIPLVYGEAQVGAKEPFAIDYTSGTWTVGYVLCLGEVESSPDPEYVYIDGEDKTSESGTLYTFHSGENTQTADTWLSNAISGYSDTMVITTPNGNIGICYIVLQYGDDDYEDWPEVICQIKGRKVYSYNNTNTIYRENFGLFLADFLSNDIYGLGMTIDPTDAGNLETYCDEVPSGDTEARYHGYLVMDRAQPAGAWIEVMRMYASCVVSYWDGEAHLIADQSYDLGGVGSVDHTIDKDDIIEGSLTFSEIDTSAAPTVVRATYTDTDGLDIWRDRPAEAAEDAGVAAGTVEYRETTLNLTGFKSHKRAHREAIRWLNKTNGKYYEATWRQFEEAYQYEIGDVVNFDHNWLIITHTLGDRYWRITQRPERGADGFWTIRAITYDDAIYSDVVNTTPASDDPTLPSRGAPGPPTLPNAAEHVWETTDKVWLSRLEISWTAPTASHVTHYEVIVKDDTSGDVLWESGMIPASRTSVATGSLPYPRTVDIEHYAYNNGLISTAALNNGVDIDGKTDVPNPPTNFTMSQRNSVTKGSWTKSTTEDVIGYRVRWWENGSGDDWDDAAGTERFYDTDTFTIVGDITPDTYDFEVRAEGVNGVLSTKGLEQDTLLIVGTTVRSSFTNAVPNTPTPYPCDTETTGSFDLRLPYQPKVGDRVSFFDAEGYFDVNPLTIERNPTSQEKILELAEDLVVDVRYASITLRYLGPTLGWVIS